ncbi:hypothetical protein BGZ57DRAFT_1012033 [Hyaloscypha finlandica]|nr:hypothetical protein BGZ57DRAFT_1012033 [Hyaloscypha finlandica]
MIFARLATVVGAVAGVATAAAQSAFVNQTTCNGKQHTYQELWVKLVNGSNTGVLWALPDRGWNTEGTLDFQPRVHKFDILFTPEPSATVANPSGNNLFFAYKETVRFFGPDGTPCTGLDADPTGYISFPGSPDLPVATYTGDGFGNAGPGGRRIPGTFSAVGLMIAAIRPVDVMRNGTEFFSADSPPFYDNKGAGDDVFQADNPTGCDNNHGFEGLTVTRGGNTLYVLMQAALNQDGGTNKQTERYTRLVEYDITVPSAPQYAREFVVPLPLYNDPTAKASKNPKWQRIIFAPSVLYHHFDIFDISSATDIKGFVYDCANLLRCH